MRNFFHVTNTFFVHKSIWVGPVIFSADSLYLIRRRGQLDERVIRILAGTTPAGRIAGAIADLSQPTQKNTPFVPTCDLADIAPATSAHPDWPVKFKSGPVIVIPRASVPSIVKRPGGGLWVCYINNVRYAFSNWIFMASRLKTFLEQNHWPLKWGEEEPEEWLESIS